MLISQLGSLLAHTHLSIRPVVDAAEHLPSSAYEHSESVKERVWHLTGGRDTFPWATGRSRRMDYDHPDPWTRGGPTGQTGTHNSQPLGRRNHRWKTHAGLRARQIAPGTYVWATHHGHYFLVGPHGTRPVDPEQGKTWFAATRAERRLVDVTLRAS